MRPTLLLILSLLLLLLPSAWSQNPIDAQPWGDEPDSATALHLSIHANQLSAAAGTIVEVTAQVKIDKGWRYYWINSGCPNMPAALQFSVSGGTILEQHTGRPELGYLEDLKEYFYGWTHTAYYRSRIKIGEGPLTVKFGGMAQLCDREGCYPPTNYTAKDLVITAGPSSSNPEYDAIAKAAAPFIAQALPSAFQARQEKDVLRFTSASPIDLKSIHFFDFETNEEPHSGPQAWSCDGTTYSLKLDPEQAQRQVKGLLGIGAITYAFPAQDATPAAQDATPAAQDARPAAQDATPAAQDATPAAQDARPVEDDEKLSFARMLFYLFIGGMTLNLMPCVFPVLALKLRSFVKLSQESRGQAIAQACAYGGGLLVSLWILVAILLSLRSGGEAIGWSFQMQNPYFNYALVVLMFAITLNLFGVFEFGTSLAAIGSDKPKDGLMGSFMTGVFATIAATPCSGPFLGGATGQLMDESSGVILLGFTIFGLGLAFPYLFFGFFPKLASFVPRPGEWMEHFKKIMGFVMAAAVAYFFWVLAAMIGLEPARDILFTLCAIGMALWVYGTWNLPHLSAPTRYKAMAVSILLGLGALVWGCQQVKAGNNNEIERIKAEKSATLAPGSVPLKDGIWEPFSEERIAEHVKAGRPVFVDFTATWCGICQANKRSSMLDGDVRRLAKEKGVVYVEGDYSRYDKELLAVMKKYGRNTVPLYLYYDGKSLQPVKWPQVLTPDLMKEAFEKLPEP